MNRQEQTLYLEDRHIIESVSGINDVAEITEAKILIGEMVPSFFTRKPAFFLKLSPDQF